MLVEPEINAQEVVRTIVEGQERVLLNLTKMGVLDPLPTIDHVASRLFRTASAVYADLVDEPNDLSLVVTITKIALESDFRLSDEWGYSPEDYTQLVEELRNGTRMDKLS